MLILGIDTSGPNGSIALVRFDGKQTQTLGLAKIQGGTFSAQLIPQLSLLLESNGLRKHEIDAFAVASGPGSFTGLRVGLSAVKALAETLERPIAAISLLEAIAFERISRDQQKATSSRIVAALDARRNEVFFGEFDISGEVPRRISENLCTRDELIAIAAGTPVSSPDASIIEYVRAHSGGDHDKTVLQVSRPDAATIAQLGFKKIGAGEIVSAFDLDANYIRRSDAEIRPLTISK